MLFGGCLWCSWTPKVRTCNCPSHGIARRNQKAGSHQGSPSLSPQGCWVPPLLFCRSPAFLHSSSRDRLSLICAHSRKWPRNPSVTQFPGSGSSSRFQSLKGEADWPAWVRCPFLVQLALTDGRSTENRHGAVISSPYILCHFLFS